MFLPVLLVRDMGLLGWVVFAVPNVLGAAALAWIVPNAEASRHLVDRHRAMAAWFSIITIAFHVFFVQWIVFRLAGLAGTMLVMAALGVCAILLSVRAVGQRWTAGLVLIGSVVLLVLLAGRGVLSMPAVDSSPAAWRGLAGLAPACFLGFLLCPYLDLTFHRARQQTSAAGGRFAFGFGFGVLFLVMILFTLLYAHLLAPGLGRQLAPAVAWLLTIHFAIQIGFTLAAHLREVWPGGPRPRPYPAAVAVAVVVASALGGLPNLGGQWLGLERGELIYRGFMGFYGLFFPAYVWICMVPGRDGGPGGKRAAWFLSLP
jgi:hypothetical protein